jgi:hypothetical protein
MDRDTMYDTMLRTAPSSAIMSWYEHLLGPTTQTLVPRHNDRSTLVHTYILSGGIACIVYSQIAVRQIHRGVLQRQPPVQRLSIEYGRHGHSRRGLRRRCGAPLRRRTRVSTQSSMDGAIADGYLSISTIVTKAVTEEYPRQPCH